MCSEVSCKLPEKGLGLLLSVRVKNLKSVNIWQSYTQDHFVRLASTLPDTVRYGMYRVSATDAYSVICASGARAPFSCLSRRLHVLVVPGHRCRT